MLDDNGFCKTVKQLENNLSKKPLGNTIKTATLRCRSAFDVSLSLMADVH